MEVFNKVISMRLIKIILLSLILIVIILCIIFSNTDSSTNPKTFNILSGLITGLLVAIFQVFLSWYEHKKIEKLEAMKILDVMVHRDSRSFYENLIRKSKSEISIMGVTASRFMEHFADANSGRDEAKVLLAALLRGVQVKLLLPEPQYLNENDRMIAEIKLKPAFVALKAGNSNFEFRYFKHAPAHSIFIVDNQCILGPVFPLLSSKDTPAIYLNNDSPFAEKYLEYFSKEWTNAI